MIYTGLNGTIYDAVEPALNKGAEGAIHKIAGCPNMVMKVIHPNMRGENRHRKLQVMLRHPLGPKAMSQVTWPVDIVYDVYTGDFAGYVMRELDMAEMVSMDQIYSGKYGLTLKENIILAKNICTVFNDIHQAGYAIGDARPDNIMVSLRTLEVVLVDTDSFHVTDPATGRIYRCEGGRPEWLPAEVQAKMRNGYNLVTAPLPTFSVESDLFALSCHCFALLMNYAHPYCCAVGNSHNMLPLSVPQPSVTAPKQHDAIYNGFTPYFMTQPGLNTPVYAPDFNYLPDTTRGMFRKAFVDGHSNPQARPTAEELKAELNRLQTALVDCRAKPVAHQYPPGCMKCPWCELEQVVIPPPPGGTSLGRTQVRPVGGGNYGSNYSTGNGHNRVSGGGGRTRSRSFGSCLGLLLSLFLGFAMVMALPVACTANLIETGNREKAYREQQAAEQMARIEQERVAREAEEAAAKAAEEALLAARPKGIMQAPDADYTTFTGSLSDSLEETTFEIDIPREGTYLVETAGTDLNLKIRVCDDTGYSHQYWLSDRAGDICGMDLPPGRYTLSVERQFADDGSFNLKIWYQKPTVDISQCNQVYDRVEFCQQNNVYRYTCSQSGEYHFLVSQMEGGLEKVALNFYDGAGNVIAGEWGGTTEGFGPFVDLVEGCDYYITIGQYLGLGDYTLVIE